MAYPQETFRQTALFGSSVISRRRDAVLTYTLRYQLEVLRKTGRYDAFRLQWHPSYADAPSVWPIPNHLFWDSDVAKWMESACYFLELHECTEIRAAVDELVEMIRGAQRPDGYINIHFTVVEPGKRFTNVRDFHELYNAGHLIEAALAHHQLYRNDRFLLPMMQYADLLCRIFGPKAGQLHGYPGHPEIELALLRLFHRTKKAQYLELARYFIEERGNPTGCNGTHFYRDEAERRGEDPHARPAYHTEPGSLWYANDVGAIDANPSRYYQAHKPLLEQESVEGHSVRAMYLLTAASDLLRYQEHDHLRAAVLRLWRNTTERKMYVTGGIGAVKVFEGFGPDFFLPQGTDDGGCYAETCAGIGLMMFAERLLHLELDHRYGDIMELCFYNAVLTGMSCDGKRFTYDNQLASSDASPSRRADWFTCACCPPNFSRLLGSIGGYLWNITAQDDETATANVHMFASANLSFTVGDSRCVLEQETNWPWEGDIRFTLTASSVSVAMNVRIPGWVDAWEIHPPLPEKIVDRGYLHIDASWLRRNSRFRLSFRPMTPRFVVPHPYTNQDTVSIMRGPIVYCAEDTDNKWVQDHFKSITINPKSCKITESLIEDKEHGEVYVGLELEDCGQLDFSCATNSPIIQHSEVTTVPLHQTLTLIPYYFRANRKGSGQMRVGMKHWR